MPRYSYIDDKLDIINNLPNLEKDEKLYRADSMTLTKEEWEILKKNEIKAFCYACDSEFTFVSKPKNKNPFFRHKHGRDECFQAESLAHAQTKKVLYKRFKEAGYTVATEKTFAGKSVRADVAVKDKIDLLAIEVQANNGIQLHTIAQRVNAYIELGMPLAWVILMDSFFGEGNYTGTSETKTIQLVDGTYKNEVMLLPYNQKAIFQVVGKEVPTNFLMLIDKYCILIAVNRNGEFFVISKDTSRESNDAFLIYRLPHDQVVEALLQTPLVKMDYEVKERKEHGKSEEFQGSLFHLDTDIELVGKKILGDSIDFEKAEEEEREKLKTEQSLNAVEEIKNTLAFFSSEIKWKDKKIKLLHAYNELIRETLSKKDAILAAKRKLQRNLEMLDALVNRMQLNEIWRIEREKKEKEEEIRRNELKKLLDQREEERKIELKLLDEKRKKVEEQMRLQEEKEIQIKLQEEEKLQKELAEKERLVQLISSSQGVRLTTSFKEQLMAKTISELQRMNRDGNQLTLF